jgi:hypothetical protein
MIILIMHKFSTVSIISHHYLNKTTEMECKEEVQRSVGVECLRACWILCATVNTSNILI